MWIVVCAYLSCILIIPYVEYPVPSVNLIKDGNTELPEHVLRNHSQKFFWEDNQFAEVLTCNMNVTDRGAMSVRLGMLCSPKIPHIRIFSFAGLWICRYYLKDYHSSSGRWHWSWSPMIIWLHIIYIPFLSRLSKVGKSRSGIRRCRIVLGTHDVLHNSLP